MTPSVQHLIEKALGLPGNYLSQSGDFSLQFNPAWPGQAFLGVSFWNMLLAVVAGLLVAYVYSHDGRSRALRIFLGLVRGSLLGLIIVLLNRPALTLGEPQSKPSVMAILIDDSMSMRVPDAGPDGGAPVTRLAAVQSLLAGPNAALVADLAKKHELHFYRFDRDALAIDGRDGVKKLTPDGESTQVLPSILSVLQDLQGQSIAGVAVFTDGRDTPARKAAEGLDQLRNYGVKVYPVAVGLDRQPKNIEVQNMQVEESAFKGDVLNVKATIRATGYEPNHRVVVRLKDQATGKVLTGPDGADAQKTVPFPDDKPIEVELQWKTGDPGNKELVVEAVPQPGELNEDDNTRSAVVSVRDTQVNVLYVDGYPRWEYRYLKTELIRERSVNVSCLLASADNGFVQEGTDRVDPDGKKVNMRISKFPDSLKALNNYDVLIIGDVDPRYFTDTQLQLINQFVTLGRGLAMMAGPRYSPQAYKGTPVEPLLPVSIGRVAPTDPNANIAAGFRPAVTKTGDGTSIFRFEPDKAANDAYLKDTMPLLFWYCHGIVAKPSVGEVLAEHPTDISPVDGHKAPILVSGRYGGRTLFSAVDETWRWRYYTGESNFDKYWVQQIRYLARNSNVDQGRQLNLSPDQPTYELGQQVRLTLRVLDPSLTLQLSDHIRVQINDAADAPARNETLMEQDGSGKRVYTASFRADRVGKFKAQMAPVLPGMATLSALIDVHLPRLELNDPRVDRVSLSRLATETLGKPLDLQSAPDALRAIPSAKKDVLNVRSEPVWDAPAVIGLFVVLVGTEWVVRKLFGMV